MTTLFPKCAHLNDPETNYPRAIGEAAKGCVKSEVREFHFQRGPQPRGQGPSDADASEYSMPYLSFFFSVCTCVVFTYSKHMRCHRRPSLRSCAFFMNLERYLPKMRGAGTPFPCVPTHFNH